MNNFTYLLLVVFLTPSLLFSQKDAKQQLAMDYLKENRENLGFEKSDIEALIVTDIVHHKHVDVTSVYFNQSFKGIPVLGANMNINITKDDEIGYSRHTFVQNLAEKVNEHNPWISPQQAIDVAAIDLKVSMTKKPKIVEQVNNLHYVFEGDNLSKRDIPVKLVYAENDNGELVLAWNMQVSMKYNSNLWDVKVDAQSGSMVGKTNMTIYCQHDHGAFGRSPIDGCKEHNHDVVEEDIKESGSAVMDGSYKVYAIPVESPNHGDQVLIESPHYPEASPFGWHDTNQEEGPEYTVTRGNNAHVFADLDGDGESIGDEPDGGAELIFDFDHLTAAAAEFNYDPAIVNLFYGINIYHDILYLYGFDESLGNFQVNNYGNGGAPNDPVVGREAVPDQVNGTATWNNASWSGLGDGFSGTISMGNWVGSSSVFQVDEPAQLQGPYSVGQSVDGTTFWGHNWTNDQIIVSGSIALARDGDPQSPTQCCGDIVNGDEVAGKIALIDRGLCEFGSKGLNAQEAGAVAVLICNVVGATAGGDGNELIDMAAGSEGEFVTIPMLFVGKDNCDLFKAAIGGGQDVQVTLSTELDSGPTTFNSSFDNGVIFHEYGHGFNSRVLGGPSSPGGLGNAEQMGEGWADYFGLVMTIRDGDTGATPRGIGTYVIGQNTQGRGIRRFPYSTDMNVCPLTYDDINGANEVHAIGEVWCAVIWDITWYMIEKYGYDADWTNLESGNGRAMRLVTDGIKWLGGNPGFMDARDALLFADEQLYDGIHNCDLWSLFARRGMGIDADQGDPDDSNDGVSNFEPLPTCIEELKIKKTITDLILPGDPLEVTLDIANHKLEAVTGVVITDNLQDGLTYLAGSANIEPTVENNVLIWDIGDMASLDELSISYILESDPDFKTTTSLYDDVEGSIADWDIDAVEGFNIWNRTSLESNSGQFSWYVDAPDTESEQSLIYFDLEVLGENPVLRFFTQYNTESGSDGGFVEISRDGGATWFRVSDKFIRGGYNTAIAYGTLAIPSLSGYSGLLEKWEGAYISMEDYAGETVNVRWRFGSDDNTTSAEGSILPGWYLDDLQLLDMVSYTTFACIESVEDGQICTDEMVTLVDASIISSTNDLEELGYSMELMPNPASDYVTVSIGSDVSTDAILELRSVDGRNLSSQRVDIRNKETFVNLDTNSLPSGFYFVILQSGNKFLTKKLIIE